MTPAPLARPAPPAPSWTPRPRPRSRGRAPRLALTQPGGLHARGGVDRVPEQAVPRHGEAHHARHARACGDAGLVGRRGLGCSWRLGGAEGPGDGGESSTPSAPPAAPQTHPQGDPNCGFQTATGVCAQRQLHRTRPAGRGSSPRGRGGGGAGSPECRPMRMRTGTSGMWRMWKEPTALRMSSAMLAISAACRCPFRWGSPEATM